jgi:transcriptional regulator with XRE-family HTH domain
MSQEAVADELGVSHRAISQLLRSAPDLGRLNAATVLEAGTPVLKALAADHGFTRSAIFGSVARGDAGPASDIDLLVQAPSGTSSFGLDDDIRRDAVLL